eukprot:NODE_9_length_64580_cov_1.431941.p3 type:complete len:1054 gc:universal NODE_9_length_64580_cov_1.431941:54285-57446(+)
MNRRTSSEIGLHEIKKMHYSNALKQDTIVHRINTMPQNNEISLSSKSNSLTTALGLAFNRLEVKRSNIDLSKSESKVEAQQDQHVNQIFLKTSEKLNGDLATSYTSMESPSMSLDDNSLPQLSPRKKEQHDLDDHSYQIEKENNSFLRSVLLFWNGQVGGVKKLSQFFAAFSKLQLIFAEIVIALAFAIPYSMLDGNDLLVLLIVNCIVIFAVLQMKKKFAMKYHDTWSIFTLIIHQMLLMYLNHVFAINENQVSTNLFLIFISSSLTCVSSLATKTIIVFNILAKALLFLVSRKNLDWKIFSLTLFVDLAGCFVALLNSLKIVQVFQKKGSGIVDFQAVIDKTRKEVELLDKMANSLLPDYVWHELKEGKHGAFTGNINKGLRYEYPKVSILFADVVGFTALSSKIDKDELLKVLNHVFTRFDKIAEVHDMEKIKTVGDCYVVVGGVTTASEDCVARCALMSLKMVEAMKEIQQSSIIPEGVTVALRIGSHVGSATGGLIGDTKMLFDIWSKDVSLASLMEQSGAPNRVHISQDFYNEISDIAIVDAAQEVIFSEIKVKSYFLEGINVNREFFKLPFIVKSCKISSNYKHSFYRPAKMSNKNQISLLQKTPHILHKFLMHFEELQIENEFIRKHQKDNLHSVLLGLFLNLIIGVVFGVLGIYFSRSSTIAILIAFNAIVHLSCTAIMLSIKFRGGSSFENLSILEKQFYKIGSKAQTLDQDVLILTTMFSTYLLVLGSSVVFQSDLPFIHGSFYICIISGYIFQGLKFPYFVIFFLLSTITYGYFLSYQTLTTCDDFRSIFFYFGITICLFNNYSRNFCSRNFFSVDTNQREELFVLQDQHLKTNKTVLKLLPKHVIDILKSGTTDFSESFPECAVIFCEIMGLSKYSNNPDLLNEIISRVDKSLIFFPGIDKVKTIYSIYMAATGITPESRSTKEHLKSALDFALSLKKHIKVFQEKGITLNFRVGISIGPIIAGLVGKSKLTYDIWGDTVNVSSRMESTADPGTIQVTQRVFHLFEDTFKFEDRGPIYVKGKGTMNTYLLLGKKRRNQSK